MPRLRPKQRLVAVCPAHLADQARAKARQDHRSLSGYLVRLITQDLARTGQQRLGDQLELELQGGG